MYCCEKCFHDSELLNMIHNGSARDGAQRCDICGSEDSEFYYDLSHCADMSDAFDELLNIFIPESALPDSFPRSETGYLRDLFCDGSEWNIFALPSSQTDLLLKTICRERYREQPELFDERVGIPETHVPDYLEKFSILKNNTWDDFLKEIKERNRFHSECVNTERLYAFLQCVAETYHQGHIFYRARIASDKAGFPGTQMGAPGHNLARAGRVNAEGIPILYLAESRETRLHEVRAGMFDYVSVGTFQLLKDIRVINLANLGAISPFYSAYDQFDFDYTQYAVNMRHLKRIAQDIAKPLKGGDPLDYLPTQYISDFIKSKGFGGIEYKSTLNPGDNNFAFFDEQNFECGEVRTVEVNKVIYNCIPALE